MAFYYDTTWYVNYGNGTSTGYYSVPTWTASTAYTVGQMVRQLATPTVGNERIFICTVAGTSNTTEPTWNLAYGVKTTDSTVTWIEVTGRTAVNGDITNTKNWTFMKGIYSQLGMMIQNNAGTYFFITTTAGYVGSGAEPSWNLTVGATTTDNGVIWTCIGATSAFSAWSHPHARVQTPTAASFALAGATVYVANTHAETQTTSMSIPGGNGSNIQPILVLSVPTTTAPATSLLAGASLTTTGNTGMTIPASANTAGYYFYGLTFNCSSGASANGFMVLNSGGIFENCAFNQNSTSAGAIGNGMCPFGTFINCTFSQPNATPASFWNNATGQAAAAKIKIQGGTFYAGQSGPPIVFQPGVYGSSRAFQAEIRDMDLSNLTGYLVSPGVFVGGTMVFYNCKLNASATLIQPGAQVAMINDPGTVKFYNCTSTANNSNYEYYVWQGAGVIQNEQTIVRTGGASDGTAAMSWNMATSAYSSFVVPLASDEIIQWNAITGVSKTATIYFASNAASLDNSKVWINVEYLPNSANTLGSIATSKMANLYSTPAALATDTSTWGGSTTYKYKIPVSFTPGQAGPIKVTVYVAAPSITIYVDPLVVIT